MNSTIIMTAIIFFGAGSLFVFFLMNLNDRAEAVIKYMKLMAEQRGFTLSGEEFRVYTEEDLSQHCNEKLLKELDFCSAICQTSGGCHFNGGSMCHQCGAPALLTKMITGGKVVHTEYSAVDYCAAAEKYQEELHKDMTINQVLDSI